MKHASRGVFKPGFEQSPCIDSGGSVARPQLISGQKPQKWSLSPQGRTLEHASMMADELLRRLDQALDSALTEECDRSERLALAVWQLVDRLGQELGLGPSEAAGQVQMMAALAAEHMACRGPKRYQVSVDTNAFHSAIRYLIANSKRNRVFRSRVFAEARVAGPGGVACYE